jgi:hypothetical protein
MTKDHALAVLRALSGEDYGYDVEAWRKKKADIMGRVPRVEPGEFRKKTGQLKRKSKSK